MTLDGDMLEPFESPAPSLAPPASRGTRLLALAGGLVALVLVTMATFGTAILALLGMAIAWWLARRRGRPLTRGASWWGAVLGVAVGFLAFTGLAITATPPGTLTRIRAANDSIRATTPRPEPPAWLKRIDPNAGRSSELADSTSERLVRSPVFLLWVGAMTMALGAALVGAVAGSLGWCAGVLLAFAATGRWLPRAGDRAAAHA